MLHDHWPLLGLRLRTPRLELRLPAPDQLAELADLAAEGIHPPDRMPFAVPWSDLPGAERARSVVQHHWRTLGQWTPDDWCLALVVLRDTEVVGMQALSARDFAVLAEVGTGSWLGQAHQGQGIGTQMRAAVLHLAFAGLGAREATSAAFADNAASYAVSARLGYRDDGVERLVVRQTPVTARRLRLSREDWARHATVPVTIEGIEPCLPLFGRT